MLPQKFVPWSEHICFTWPQMAMKHLKAFMKQIWCLLCPLVDQQSPVLLANQTSKDKGTYASFVSHNPKACHTNDTFSKMYPLMLRLIMSHYQDCNMMFSWNNAELVLVESSVRSRHTSTESRKSIFIYEEIQCEESWEQRTPLPITTLKQEARLLCLMDD